MRIAIIGAGPAGLSAAYRLKMLGYSDITVLEKRSEAGGKVSTTFIDSRPVELGANIVNNQYREVIKLAEEFHMELVPYNSARYVLESGKIVTIHEYARSLAFKPLIVFELMRFLYFSWKYPSIRTLGHLDAELPLMRSTNKMADAGGFPLLTKIFEPCVSGLGYGYFSEVPGLYTLKMLEGMIKGGIHSSFGYHSKGMRKLANGYQGLWKKIASQFSVVYGSRITAINRVSNNSQRQVTLVDKGKERTFDCLIMAAPLKQLLSIQGLQQSEIDLFGQIRYYNYSVVVFRSENLPLDKTYYFPANVTIHKDGDVVALTSPYEDLNVYIAYQQRNYQQTDDQVNSKLVETVRSMGGEVKEIILRKNWSYFPHVSTESLANGFYEKLEGLQGKMSTYYTGGVLNFETVEDTVRYSYSLVDKFFKPEVGLDAH